MYKRVKGYIGKKKNKGKVLKGKKMEGKMGKESVKVKRIEVVRVEDERKMMMVKGDVKGEKGREMIVKKDVKE